MLKFLKQIKILIAFFCVAFLTHANALEFTEYGHKAMAMGGAGVAVKKNPYATFYNPALTSANPATSIAYSVGVNFAEKNILEAFNYDFNNISDVYAFNELLAENFLNLSAGGAFAFKIPDLLPFGQLSLGFAYNVYATANFTGSLPTNITNIGDRVSFNMRRLDLMEIPVSYAFTSNAPIGDLSFGVALKFMNAKSKLTQRILQITDTKDDIMSDITDTLNASGATNATNVGLDLGVLYQPVDFPSLSVALSAKNINAPKFKFGQNGDLKIKPQARLGVAWEFAEFFTLGADIDLTSNELISASDIAPVQKSQKMGLGLDFDSFIFDLRAGVAKDLKQDNGAILSLGLGFGFFDIGFAIATDKTKVEDTNYPRYFALQIGGGIQF